jgi:uncharacterized SAM-binding protein YcdF (DUF218 family)
VISVAGGLVVLFVGGTLRLFVFPGRDKPRHVDAIMSLGGYGPRLATAVKLAKQGYASNLVVSDPQTGCPDPIEGVRIICFDPHPRTTQGEARKAAELVKQNGWTSLMVVTTPDQITRARIRFQRCTGVKIAWVGPGLPLSRWPYAIAYEWAALGKALVLQRSC